MNTISEKILQKRKELGMTQRALAEVLNVSDKTVSRWETGSQIPDALIIPELAKVLGISIQELYGIENEVVQEVKEQVPVETNKKLTYFKAALGISFLICVLGGVLQSVFVLSGIAKEVLRIGILGILVAEAVFLMSRPKNHYENIKWFGFSLLGINFIISVWLPSSYRIHWLGEVVEINPLRNIVLVILFNLVLQYIYVLFWKRVRSYDIKVPLALNAIALVFAIGYIVTVKYQPLYAWTPNVAGTTTWRWLWLEQCAGMMFLLAQTCNYFFLLCAQKQKTLNQKWLKYSFLTVVAAGCLVIVSVFGGYFRNSLFHEMSRSLVSEEILFEVKKAEIYLEANDKTMEYALTDKENLERFLTALREIEVKESEPETIKDEYNMRFGKNFFITLTSEDGRVREIKFFNTRQMMYDNKSYVITNTVDWEELCRITLSEYEEE